MENAKIQQTSLEIKERFAKVNVQIQERDIVEQLSNSCEQVQSTLE